MVDEQLTYLSFSVDVGDAAPTQAQVETFDMLSNRSRNSYPSRTAFLIGIL